MSSLLEVRGLSVTVSGADRPRPVVRDVSFRIDRGETVALVGESGSGKTMTALALLGLLPHGVRAEPGVTIRLGGREIGGDPDRGLARLRGGTVALVPQDGAASLNPVRRVGAQSRGVLRAHGTAGDRGERVRSLELLAEVGLEDPERIADAYAHQLSGGMQQRALVALALAGEPDLLVADEPTSALDAPVRLQILDLLARLGRTRRLGILLITHDFSVVRRASSRVIVFHAGRIVEEGPTLRVLEEPLHPYTRALVAALPFGGRPRERFAVPARGPLEPSTGTGCSFRGRCPLAEERCALDPRIEEVEEGRRVRCWVTGS